MLFLIVGISEIELSAQIKSLIFMQPKKNEINGTNYGKLIKIGPNIWFSKDISFPTNDYYANIKCPLGFM